MISAILPYRREGRNLSREDSRLNPTSQFRATSPLTARAKTGAIFVKKINYRWAIRYRPAEPPSSSRDENSILVKKSKSGMSDKSDHVGTLLQPPDEKYIFVKNCTPSEPNASVSGGWAASRLPWAGFQFSSRDFPKGDSFSDPLLIAASFAYLDLSYRTIPLRANPLRLPSDRRCEIREYFSSRNE